MMIGRFEKPRPFDGKTGSQLGFHCHKNQKA